MLPIKCPLRVNTLPPLYSPGSYMGNFHFFKQPLESIFWAYFKWTCGLVRGIAGLPLLSLVIEVSLSIDTRTADFPYYMISEAVVFQNAAAVIMILTLHITLQGIGGICLNIWANPFSHLCLIVVCKKRAKGAYFRELRALAEHLISLTTFGLKYTRRGWTARFTWAIPLLCKVLLFFSVWLGHFM